MDIHQLMNIPVSLASRTTDNLFSTPSASYVITREDIQRSGLRSIPELLRLVPGLQVGKIDANKWAITSRSLSGQFSGSMLVMMDQRILYNPLFSGTYWEVQDYVLADIERIEVIRGPGGASWGANASHGVVNIITRSANVTQGNYAHASLGKGETKSELSYRHGFSNNSSNTRIYAKQRNSDQGKYLNDSISNNDNFFITGDDAHDDGTLKQLGFRSDISPSKNETLTIQGDYSEGDLKDIRYSDISNKVSENDIDTRNANIMARWSKQLNLGHSIQLNTYYDWADRSDDGFIDKREAFNIDFQHNFSINQHALSWGVEYRQSSDKTDTPTNNSSITARLSLDPRNKTEDLEQLFIQDKFTLIDKKLQLVTGARYEHNDYTGNELQPNARLSYTPTDNTTYWLAASRSVRTPSRGDADLYLDFNDLISICGSLGPDVINDPVLGCIQPLNPEKLKADITKSYEFGYRNQFNQSSLLDIATFYNDIHKNISTSSEATSRSYGAEIDFRYSLSRQLRLDIWYAKIKTFEDDSSGAEQIKRGLRENSAHARLYWDINPKWQFDTLAYYASAIRRNNGSISSTSLNRLDAHIGWQLEKNLKLDLYLTNITDDVHGEERESTRINTGVPRGFLLSGSINF